MKTEENLWMVFGVRNIREGIKLLWAEMTYNTFIKHFIKDL